MQPVLEINNLSVCFETDKGNVLAVENENISLNKNVNISLNKGEVLGVVGESGCGKSVTAMSVMRLIPTPPGKITSGEIWFKGENLVKVSEKRMRSIRGNEIAMIFQEPMTSLNPVFTIGEQVSEAIEIHQKVSRKEAIKKAIDILN
jgi:peptide/nickel transport system ATP-binding protein